MAPPLDSKAQRLEPGKPPEPEHILVAEDYDDLRMTVEMILQHAGYRVTAVADGQAAWTQAQNAPIDLVLADLRLPHMDGLALLRAVTELPDAPPVIIMTGFGTIDSAVEATKLGAYGYMIKPLAADRLCHVVGRALEERRLRKENMRLRQELAGRGSLGDLVGESRPLRELLRLVAVVAPTETSILITGKSGTGKELVARAIHQASRRQTHAFVAVNCGGLSDTLLESELFGHTKGAFTGAVTAKRGLFQQADHGTLFLDEVGEMTPALQVKLLRALQDGEVRPLGAERSARVDVRVLAATNRDLRQAIADGQFREDLYYRLNVITLSVPTLAERADDIPLLARHFVAHACAREERAPLRIRPEAMDLLQSHTWPGNIRELRNAMERAVALAGGGDIGRLHLPPDLRNAQPSVQAPWWRGETALATIERQAILHALKRAGGNRVAAARLLGISERSLYRKLARHQLRDAA